MTDLEKTLEDLKLLNALCHGTVLDDAIALLKEKDTVEHALNVLRENGWTMEKPIVRCKDCKKHNTMNCYCNAWQISDDWFCADGERQEGR